MVSCTYCVQESYFGGGSKIWGDYANKLGSKLPNMPPMLPEVCSQRCCQIYMNGWGQFAESKIFDFLRPSNSKGKLSVKMGKYDTKHDFGESEGGFGFSEQNSVHGTKNQLNWSSLSDIHKNKKTKNKTHKKNKKQKTQNKRQKQKLEQHSSKMPEAA